jgi:hypothetical protein
MLSPPAIKRLCLAAGLAAGLAGIAQSVRPVSTASGRGSHPIPSATAAPRTAQSAGPRALDPALVVQAAATLTRFCRLVDQRRYRHASSMLATARVWPLHRLRAMRRFSFIVARLVPHARSTSITFRTRLIVACAPRTPRAARRDCLYFTLGRDGTTGDWLITAVGTHP